MTSGNNGDGFIDEFDEGEEVEELDRVVLVSEEGEELQFVRLAIIEHEGSDYVMLALEEQLLEEDGDELEIYLFSYEDTMDAFSIPHDIRLNEEIWRVQDGEYDHKNRYWCAWHITELIAGCSAEARPGLERRAQELRATYAQLSAVYQASKGGGAEIPLA